MFSAIVFTILLLSLFLGSILMYDQGSPFSGPA